MLIIILSIIVVIIAQFIYLNQKSEVRKEKEIELKAITDLKAQRIAEWNNDELNDAVVLASNFFLKTLFNEWQSNKSPELKSRLQLFLENLKAEHGYSSIIFTDCRGNLISSTENEKSQLDSHLINTIQRAANEKETFATEFYKCPATGITIISYVSPIMNSFGKAVSIISFQKSFDSDINPNLSSIIHPGLLFETELIKIDGDSVVYLNNLKTDKNIFLPSNESQDNIGFVFDCSNDSSKYLCYLTKVNGTNWHMLTKIDEKEAYKELKTKTYVILLFTGLLILLIAAGLSMIYSMKQRSVFRLIAENHEEFRTTLYSIGDAVITTDKQGKIRYLNHVAEELTGWKESEAQNKLLSEVFNIINEETRISVESPVDKVLKEGVVIGLANHTMLISKTGKEIPITDSGAPIKNKQGEIIGVVLVFRDQTVERMQQKKLLESEQRLSATMDVMLEGCQIIGFDWTYVYLNKVAVEQSKASLSDLLGKRFTEFWQGIEETILFKKMQKCMKERISMRFDNVFEYQDGSSSIFDINILPVPEGILILSLDITESRKAAEALKNSEEKFRRLFETHSAIKLLIDFETGAIVDVNKSAVDYYGWSAEEFKKLKISQINTMPPEIVKNEMEKVRINKYATFEFKHRLKDGTIRDVEVYSSILMIAGKEYLHSIIHDITEKKRLLQELIKAKERAEESDNLKTAFLQNMSHEIRTPLNGIIGFSNLLAAEEPTPEEIKEFTAIIQRSGNRLLEIVNNVLDISKIETGQLEYNLKPFALNSLMAQIFSFFSPFANAKDIALSYETEFDDENCIIVSDETKLNQILTNLINNAVKFTRKGEINYGYKTNGDMIQFNVSDTGIGIAPENIDKIFVRFSQLDMDRTLDKQGAGLGLSICKGLVEGLGGNIWLESELNKGTTFYFNVPFMKGTHLMNTTDKDIQPESLSKKVKILIAEDDFESFKYLSSIFKDNSYVLVHAINGKQAVDYVRKADDFDLVLLDIRMPVMDGFEAVKLIKEINPSLPVIAQTAYAFSEEKKRILAVGCDDYIAKPIEKRHLMELVHKYLKNKESV